MKKNLELTKEENGVIVEMEKINLNNGKLQGIYLRNWGLRPKGIKFAEIIDFVEGEDIFKESIVNFDEIRGDENEDEIFMNELHTMRENGSLYGNQQDISENLVCGEKVKFSALEDIGKFKELEQMVSLILKID